MLHCILRGRGSSHAAAALFALLLAAAPHAGASGTLSTDAPVQIIDTGAAPGATSNADGTNYLLSADLDGDTDTDLVNVTPNNVHVLLNRGPDEFGVPIFEEVQVFQLPSSHGGGLFDMNNDDRPDLVLGSESKVVLGTNNGSGTFTVSTLFTHGFAQPTVATPYRVVTPSFPGTPTTQQDRIQIVVAPAASFVFGDLLGSNPGGMPFGYVVVPPGQPTGPSDPTPGPNGEIVLQQLPAVAADRMSVGDADADGDTDIVIGSRSASGASPVVVLTGRAVQDGTTLLAPAPSPVLGPVSFPFGFQPAVSSAGDIGFGSWQGAYLLSRRSLTGTLLAGNTVLDQPDIAFTGPLFIDGDTTSAISGEVHGLAFADMDGNPGDEILMTGAFTSLVMACIDTDPNDPTNRFEAPSIQQKSTSLAVANWDNDVLGVNDVLVGGARGVFFFRNTSGGDPGGDPGGGDPGGGDPGGGDPGGGDPGGGDPGGGDPGPAGPTPEELALGATTDLLTLLDPTRDPPFANPAARTLLAQALAELHMIQPTYLTAGAFTLGTPESDQALEVFFHLAHAANLTSNALAALDAVQQGQFGAELQSVIDALSAASSALAEDALGLVPVVAPAKPSRRERRVARFRASAEREIERAEGLFEKASRRESPRQSGRLVKRGILRNRRAYKKALQGLALARGDG